MDLPKYVRIQGRETAWVTKKPVGIFALGWRKVKNDIFSEEDKEKFMETENWFVENLPYPPFYGENNDDPNANTIGAITFFKNNDNAKIMFERLAPIFKLLDKYQIPYDIVYTNYAGRIIYEDEYQIGVINGE
ncbi:MAG: hypothetical protein FWD71_00510 [Oscillospiraceae bacterium]|nr:hypothetical protein [Oscillospiraceae bacterium]